MWISVLQEQKKGHLLIVSRSPPTCAGFQPIHEWGGRTDPPGSVQGDGGCPPYATVLANLPSGQKKKKKQWSQFFGTFLEGLFFSPVIPGLTRLIPGLQRGFVIARCRGTPGSLHAGDLWWGFSKQVLGWKQDEQSQNHSGGNGSRIACMWLCSWGPFSSVLDRNLNIVLSANVPSQKGKPV